MVTSKILQGRKGFTLIELLVVMLIIAIMIALLVPAVQQVRASAARTQTTNNLKQIALAAQTFHDANNALPFNGVSGNGVRTTAASGSWAYQILPYVDQQVFFDSAAATLPATTKQTVPAYLCAIRNRPGYVSGSYSTTTTLAAAAVTVAKVATVSKVASVALA